jgi:hypothetical protein
VNSSSSASYSSQSYFPNTYRSSDSNYYGSNQWRKSSLSGSGGDSRLSSSNKFRSSLTNSVPQNKSYNSWSSYTNPNKVPVSNNRTGRSYSSKDRRSSSSLLNSTKVSDTYYPRSNLSSSYYPKAVDRYSSLNYARYSEKSIPSSSGSGSYKSSYGDSRTEDIDSTNVSFDRDDSKVEDDDDDEGEEEDNDLELQSDLLQVKQDDFSRQAKAETKADEGKADQGEVEDEKYDERGEQIDEQDKMEEDNVSESEGEQEVQTIKTEPVSSKPPHDLSTKQTDVSKVENDMKPKVDLSSGEIMYLDGCQFPQTEIDTRFADLVKEFEQKTVHDNGNYLKYSLAKPIKNFNDFPFWRRNFQNFSVKSNTLKDSLKHKQKSLTIKKVTLWKEYQDQYKVWQDEKIKMDQQLQVLHPPDDEMKREIESSDLKKQQQFLPFEQSELPTKEVQFTSRRSRRHGDLVTTEAEFQEILENLSREQDEDPLVRAERLAAPIPDMILDPIERDYVKFMNSNNIVRDRKTWAERVKSDFFDNFSSQEHELFCEGFCLYPKQFGMIASHMGGLRTASDCVMHYYITKKAVNYKQLLAQFKKKASKKRGRGKQGRSRNPSQTQTPVSTPISENAPSDFYDIVQDNYSTVSLPIMESEMSTEQIFTDTGRRKRAAAPEFKGDEIGQVKKKPKNKKEVNNGVVENEQMEAVVSEPNAEMEEKTVFESDETNQAVLSDNADSDSKEKRKTISSYWSITEANLFPDLLYKYGTKWTTIADELATKSATMVKNYFQRNAEKNDWNRIAAEADNRLKAKFAAVLKTDDTEGEALSPPTSGLQSTIPIGTFQHASAKVNINSLMSQSPTKDSAIENHVELPIPTPIPQEASGDKSIPALSHLDANAPNAPVRSSIMSLLNSELPVKAQAPAAAQAPVSTHHPLPHTNAIKDLLNSPSVSNSNSSTDKVGSNLSNLLAE